MNDDRDWYERAQEVADRFRAWEEMPAPNPKPKPVKRVASYMPPSGASAKHINRVNAQKRIRAKRTRGTR
jgi:hypothetical protein